MREDPLRLADVLEAFERIRGFRSGGRATFLADRKSQDAVTYELLKLGEAANRLSPSFRKAHPVLPWERRFGLRNEIVHECFRVDPDALREFVEKELNGLERRLRSLKAQKGAA